MKTLSLDGICADFSCALCCYNTEMILSKEDVRRLVAQGYRERDFCFQDTEGFIRLKNSKGHCFFLRNNSCIVYEHRPQGCRFYPLIFDLDNNEIIVDDECPLEETISEGQRDTFALDLKAFIEQIINEQKARIKKEKKN